MNRFTLRELQVADHVDLGTSAPYLIDQGRVDRFADATDDRQWIHTEPERARTSPYGGTIVHGFLVLSLLPKLVFQLIELEGVGMVVNFGADKLRFLHPVPVGSAVELDATLIQGQPRSGGALLRLHCAIRIAGTRKRALVAEQLLLAMPEAAPPESDD